MIRRFFLFLAIVTACIACSDDDAFTTSPTATLTFSVDTVRLDTVFSTVGSRTYDFWVYNRSRASLRVQSVRLRQGNQTGFRVNVDGSYLDNTLGSITTDLEVRRDDSLRVFVELTAPENGQLDPIAVEDQLLFLLESGVEQRVVLSGHTWDAELIDTLRIQRDTLLQSQRPIVIYGALRVDSTVTLSVRNTTFYFYDGSGVDVYGTLKAENSVFRGDRLDHMFDYLPYDRVSGQWRGIRLYGSSTGNEFIGSEVRNAMNGIVCDSAALSPQSLRLYMERTVVHNCKGYGVQAFNAFIGLVNCQLTNTLGDCLAVYGGACEVRQCTLGQFYPFSADRGAALRFTNYHGSYAYPLEKMLVTGSIVTGYADDVVMGETRSDDSITVFSYHFENTLLRTPQPDSASLDTTTFVRVRWESPKDSIQGKQHFRLIDEENLIYDFHLDSVSNAQGLGCYVENEL